MQKIKTDKSGPLVLLIIDGWGVGLDKEDNLIFSTKTNNFDELISKFPSTALKINGSNLGENYRLLGTGGSDQSLSDIIEANNLSQIKIGEVEKYAYLSYFFNNKQERKRNQEDRILIPSNFSDNYSDKPEMASAKVTSAIIKTIKNSKHDFIVASLANLDLVAYSKNNEAVRQAITLIDGYIKKITKAVMNKKGTLVVTACRGNAESAQNKKSSNPVPFIIVNSELEGKTIISKDINSGLLSSIKPTSDLTSIAPTILKLMKINHTLPNESLI